MRVNFSKNRTCGGGGGEEIVGGNCCQMLQCVLCHREPINKGTFMVHWTLRSFPLFAQQSNTELRCNSAAMDA